MPRTKVVKKKDLKDSKSDANNGWTGWTIVSKMLQDAEQSEKEALKRFYEEQLRQKNLHFQGLQMSFTTKMLSKTVAELLRGEYEETTVSSLLCSTASTTTSQAYKSRRSVSLGADEGYLTAESGNSTGGRRSRLRTKPTDRKASTVSRSLSRTNVRKGAASGYKTPTQKNNNNIMGTITPKCKTNSPQVLLRRPKQGEMAVSLQGSPLYTGPVVADNMANVNIPLPNGNLFTLQPQRGLRLSQLPPVDSDTQKQLQVLRDHLNKVCALVSKKY